MLDFPKLLPVLHKSNGETTKPDVPPLHRPHTLLFHTFHPSLACVAHWYFHHLQDAAHCRRGAAFFSAFQLSISTVHFIIILPIMFNFLYQYFNSLLKLNSSGLPYQTMQSWSKTMNKSDSSSKVRTIHKFCCFFSPIHLSYLQVPLIQHIKQAMGGKLKTKHPFILSFLQNDFKNFMPSPTARRESFTLVRYWGNKRVTLPGRFLFFCKRDFFQSKTHKWS